MSVSDERQEALWRSTPPLTANDPVRFGESREAVVDLLAAWLRGYFDRNAAPAGHLAEVPGLRKWMTYAQNNGLSGPVPPNSPGNPQPRNTGGGGGGAVPAPGGSQLPSRAVTVATWGEKCEDFPRIVVGVTRLADIPGFNRHIVASGLNRPYITSATAGPWALAAGDTVSFQMVRNSERLPNGSFSNLRGAIVPAEVTITLSDIDVVDFTEVTAEELACVINEQGQGKVCAAALADGSLRVYCDAPGIGQGGLGPAWLEVTGGTIAETLGWWREGTVVSIAANGNDWNVTLDAGAALTNADEGKYLTLSGTTRPSRTDGRWLITDRVSATVATVEIPYGVANATPTAATWYIGAYASTLETTRSVRRIKLSTCDVEIRILAEDYNSMQALSDAVHTLITFFADRDSGSILGRGLQTQLGVGNDGILQPAAPTQCVSFHFKLPASVSGDMKTPRAGAATDGTYECSISVGGYVQEALDRTLTTTPPEFEAVIATTE